MEQQPYNPEDPIKVGHNFEEIYLHNDEQGRPLYGFTLQGHTFTKFHTYPNFHGEIIELPQLPLTDDPFAITHADMLAAQAEQGGLMTADTAPSSAPNPVRDAMSSDEWLQNYAQGGLTIAKGCFAGHRHLSLSVPHNYAVKLAKGCFDKNAVVELFLPQAIGIKHVDYSYATPHGRSSDQWLLLAHHAFNYQAARSDSVHFAMYDAHDYQPRENECCFFVKTLPSKKLTTCNLAGKACGYQARLSATPNATMTHVIARDLERDR